MANCKFYVKKWSLIILIPHIIRFYAVFSFIFGKKNADEALFHLVRILFISGFTPAASGRC